MIEPEKTLKIRTPAEGVLGLDDMGILPNFFMIGGFFADPLAHL